jgi:hypothetical protein
MTMITTEMLERAHLELPAMPERQPEDCFGLVYLEGEFQLPREKAVGQVAFGGSDPGINAFHADPGLKNLYLFRCEWDMARTCFQAPLNKLIESGMERIFGEGPPGIAIDPFLAHLKGRLLDYQGTIDRVFVRMVFTGDPAEADRSAVYVRLREELENKKHLVDRFFGRPVTLVFQIVSTGEKGAGAPAHQRETHTYPLKLEKTIEMNGPSGEVMRVGFARLEDLHAIYREMGMRFFESNIRYVLADTTPTNRSLNSAFAAIMLEGKRDPLVYAFDHNGVTLFAEKVEAREGSLLLTEPRMLNGAQTVSTFDRFLKANAEKPALGEHVKERGEISVLCKIISDAQGDFVQAVTINNNRQNPVRPWALHSNDLIQLELQDRFREELGLYYERQEAAFLSVTGELAEDAEPGERKAVELLKLAQTFLATDGELERMSRLQAVFETDEDYTLVFGPSRLKADLKQVLLCYKIQFRLARIIREIMERGEKKYSWMRRARNLVWALLCQAVLNEEDLAGLADKYGRKLGIETGYTELLAGLASTRVRFAVAEAVALPAYAAKVEKESFGFLRTNAVYDAAFKIAEEKWGWKEKSLR